ncbi:MAG: hypothetical protein JXR77_09815, partial [Lentisphaeria bacterium]|nr:hypothetical protein [Lentisphaeria bacterium]
MGFLADFLPFYPKSASPRRRKAPRYDVDRALDVEMLPHPTLERRRADTGEVVLRITRQLHPAERLLGR